MKVRNNSWVTQTRSESSSFKDKANVIFTFQTWIHYYETDVFCILTVRAEQMIPVSHRRWNKEKFNKSRLAIFIFLERIFRK